MSISQPHPDQSDWLQPNKRAPGQEQRESAGDKQDQSTSVQDLVESSAEMGVEKTKAGAKWSLDFKERIKRDEVTKLSAMLAYYFLMSIVPLLVVLLSFIGIVIGNLSSEAEQNLVSKLASSTPVSQDFIQAALNKLAKGSGIVAVASVLISAYTGSRLFINIDYCFTRIYHVPARTTLRKWLIALAMLAVFVVLVPLLLAVSAIPSVLSSAVFSQVFGHSVITNILVTLATALFGLLVAGGLFVAIYVVIPNQRLRARDSWQGALVAGFLLELYIAIFPFYITHFLSTGSLGATAGFALVALILFYYFGFILLLGAEINAFLLDRSQGGSGVPEVPPTQHEDSSALNAGLGEMA